jgi:acylphosphatase
MAIMDDLIAGFTRKERDLYIVIGCGEGFMAIRLVIEGRVQGVGYRAWTAREASARGLDGWVRNRRDGSVEALFAGDADTVRLMVLACHKGPALAHVTRLTPEPAADPDTSGFATLPTAG